MKLVKNFVYAALLVAAITVNTFAGEQDTPTVIQPPPKATAETGVPPVTDPYFEGSGEITAETTDYLFFEALAALLSVY
jgi:hypothetical protein